MKRNSSYNQNKTHLRHNEDLRIPLCNTKIYEFESSENFELINCKKCQIIIAALVRAQAREEKRLSELN